RKFKRASFEAFCEKAKSLAGRKKNLHLVPALVAEHEEGARLGIGSQTAAHYRSQPVEAVPKIDLVGRQEDPDGRGQHQHGLRSSRWQNAVFVSPLAFQRSMSRRQWVSRWARAAGVLSPVVGYLAIASSLKSRWPECAVRSRAQQHAVRRTHTDRV